MSQSAFNSITTTALAVAFGLAVFLAKSFFEETKNVEAQFQAHVAESGRTIAELKGHDALLGERISGIEAKLEEVRQDVKLVLQRVR